MKPRTRLYRHALATMCALALVVLAGGAVAAPASADAPARGSRYETREAALQPGPAAPRTSRAEEVVGVFGTDDREQVFATVGPPFSMTVFLLAEWPSGNVTSCSGFMIGPHTVGTAGHCVYETSEGGWPDRVSVVPGANGDLEPFGRFWAATAHTISGWSDDEDSRFDIGALTLDTDVGNDTGLFSMSVDSDATLLSSSFSITGYPGDKPAATMWMSSGPIDELDEYVLYFQLDVTHGNSGGPVIGRTADGTDFVVGIVSAGTDTTNIAVRMNQTVLDSLTGWRDGVTATPDVPVATGPPAAVGAPGLIAATPSVITGAAGEVAVSRLVVGATEGGGDLTITTSGGVIAVDQLLSPSSCAGGTAACVDETGSLTTAVSIPDAGNDLSTVVVTLAGTLQVSKTVLVTVTQGGATWSTTLDVVVQAATPAPTPTPAGMGTFDRTLTNLGVNAAVWNGGTVDQLSTAVLATRGISVTVFAGGRAVVLIPGAPAFVNAWFVVAFPAGVPSGTIVLVVR